MFQSILICISSSIPENYLINLTVKKLIPYYFYLYDTKTYGRMSTGTSKKSKYERVVIEGIPFFKDNTGKLYLWENSGTVVESPFHIGQLSTSGDSIALIETEEARIALTTKLTEWREKQRPRTREQIRRTDAIATISPGAITVDEAASITKEDKEDTTEEGESTTGKKPRQRRTRKPKTAAADDAGEPTATAPVKKRIRITRKSAATESS
jgi:hypothetical protein